MNVTSITSEQITEMKKYKDETITSMKTTKQQNKSETIVKQKIKEETKTLIKPTDVKNKEETPTTHKTWINNMEMNHLI